MNIIYGLILFVGQWVFILLIDIIIMRSIAFDPFYWQERFENNIEKLSKKINVLIIWLIVPQVILYTTLTLGKEQE